MIIRLKRVAERATYTQGYLFIDNQYFCDTLEPRVARPKGDSYRYRELALPKGRYLVMMRYSPLYRREVPMVRVTDDRYRLFHTGRKPCDARGFVVGKNAAVGWMNRSKSILNRLQNRIECALILKRRVILVIE